MIATTRKERIGEMVEISFSESGCKNYMKEAIKLNLGILETPVKSFRRRSINETTEPFRGCRLRE
jgi:hypothetical protein